MLLTCTFIFQMPHKKRAYALVFTSIFKSFHQLVLSKSTVIIYVINKLKQKKQPIFQMYEDNGQFAKVCGCAHCSSIFDRPRNNPKKVNSKS